MKFIYNDDGELIGKFNENKTKFVATNKEQGDTRWATILKTASGNYVLKHASMWQNERDTYHLLTRDEAMEWMEKWGYSEERVREEFPDYVPQETI